MKYFEECKKFVYTNFFFNVRPDASSKRTNHYLRLLNFAFFKEAFRAGDLKTHLLLANVH